MTLQEIYSLHREDMIASDDFQSVWQSDIPVKFRYDKNKDFFKMNSYMQENALVRLQEKFQITTATNVFQESFFSLILEVFDSFFLLKDRGNYNNYNNNNIKQYQQTIRIDKAACRDFHGRETVAAVHVLNRNIAVDERHAVIKYEGLVRHNNKILFEYSYFFTKDSFCISIMKDRFDQSGYNDRKSFELDNLAAAFEYIKRTFKTYFYDNFFLRYQSIFPVMKNQDSFCREYYTILAYYSFSLEKMGSLLDFMKRDFSLEYESFQKSLESSPKDALNLFMTFGDLLEMTSYT